MKTFLLNFLSLHTAALNLICINNKDKSMSMKTKNHPYKTVIEPGTLCVSETLSINIKGQIKT